MENIIIRNVRKEDLPDVVDIQIRGWQTAYKGIIDQKYLDTMSKEERLEKRKKDYTQNSFIVAEIDNKVVGFCRFIDNNSFSSNREDIDCELLALYVKPELKRNGIGREMFEYVTKDFISKGKKHMILWCLKDNIPSRKFYEKMGGTLSGEKDFVLENQIYKEVGYLYNL